MIPWNQKPINIDKQLWLKNFLCDRACDRLPLGFWTLSWVQSCFPRISKTKPMITFGSTGVHQVAQFCRSTVWVGVRFYALCKRWQNGNLNSIELAGCGSKRTPLQTLYTNRRVLGRFFPFSSFVFWSFWMFLGVFWTHRQQIGSFPRPRSLALQCRDVVIGAGDHWASLIGYATWKAKQVTRFGLIEQRRAFLWFSLGFATKPVVFL